jgi:hypothetical protein
MAEPNTGCDGRQAMGWIATPPPGASSRWVGRGWWRRILSDSLNGLRKKNIYWWHPFYFIFCVIYPRSSPTRSHFIPPCALHRSRVLSYTSPVAPACFRLVVGWICVIYYEDSPRHKKILMTRSTRLCTLLGYMNELWGSLTTFTTTEVCTETPCLKHPVAQLGLNKLIQ